jgi:5-deoxy-D-glucuronate isomerase
LIVASSVTSFQSQAHEKDIPDTESTTEKTRSDAQEPGPGFIMLRSSTVENRWDEKAGLRRDAVRSQVIDVLKAQEIKETGNEED